MDSGTIIIVGIFITMAILPFYFTGKKYRLQKKKLVKGLINIAGNCQVKLFNFDVCGNVGIGMDENVRFLFFVRIVEDGLISQEVFLKDFNRCKLNIVRRNIEKEETVIDRIELVLFPLQVKKPPLVIEIYNSEKDNLTLTGELQVALMWERIIGKGLKTIKKEEHDFTSVRRNVRI